jgi:hypothetical protein
MFNGHYYYAVTGGTTFSTTTSLVSSSTYLGLQGHLVTVTSQAEYDFLKNLTSSAFWIAASNAQTQGSWIWTAGPDTGLSVSPTFWAPSQPSKGTAANCAVMNSTGFADQSCTNFGAAYIVEYECQTATTSTCPRESILLAVCVL